MTNRKIVLFLLIVAAVFRVISMFVLEDIAHPQTWEHEVIANNLLEGKGFFYTSFGTEYRNSAMILYSLLCAFIYAISNHSFLMLKLLQIVISISSCYILYRIGVRLFGEYVGLIVLILIAFHPPHIVFSTKLHPLVLDTLMFILSIFFILKSVKQPIAINFLLCGFILGITILSRATIGFFIPILFLFILLSTGDYKTGYKNVFIISIGIFLIISPLIVRNQVLYNKFLVFPTDSGINFWTGNNPYATGAANTLSGKAIINVAPQDFINSLYGKDEITQNQIFYQAAFEFIKQNPYSFFILFFKKIYYLWWFSPVTGLNYPVMWLFVYKMYYIIALIFAFIGIYSGFKVASREIRSHMLIIIIFIISITIAQALYYVDGRHRWTLEPMLLIFSSQGIIYALNRVKFTRRLNFVS